MRGRATLAIVALGFAFVGAAPAPGTLRGYTLAGSAREHMTEAQFIDIPSAQNALTTATVIGARPHYAGTTGDYALAVFMRDAFRAAGISAELERFTARVDSPRQLSLQLAPAVDIATSAGHRRKSAEFPVALNIAEIAEPSDAATAARGIGLPFNSGSGDGDVRAPLVYADTGLDADYDMLAQAHVEVRGAIVLVRYGAQFRGLLAERAQARGAAGVIFYSDPKDDGAARGTVYPNGPWRPLTAIQRGSVGNNIRIPTLPISAANAQLLLSSLRGVAGPTGWGGALPVAYPLARGPGRVHLIVKLTRKTTLLWNTIGIIPGVHGDQSVILGAHRDAWVYGVGDNGDGITTMLEVAHGLGYLVKTGWRPQRTIVIAGWDGEEIGLVGSRAYQRLHRIELERGCVAYLNADENVTGQHFGADAVAAIAPVIVDATHAVPDPATPSGTVYDRWVAQTPGSRPHIDAPGGGSDHEPFLYESGIPISNLGFAGPFGVYHSSYDTLQYATHISDPNFVFHRATAQLYGLIALRLADADVVPYTFGGYIALLRTGVSQIAARAARETVPLDLAPLQRAIDALAYATVRIDPRVARANLDVSEGELRAAHELDALVYGVNGYASVAFPAIDAAFLTHDTPTIAAAIGQAVAALTRATAALTF